MSLSLPTDVTIGAEKQPLITDEIINLRVLKALVGKRSFFLLLLLSPAELLVDELCLSPILFSSIQQNSRVGTPQTRPT